MVETLKAPDLQEQIKDGVQQPEINVLNDFLAKPENVKILMEKVKSAGEQNLVPVITAFKDALPNMDLSAYADLKSFINVVESLKKIFPFPQTLDLKNAFSDLQAVLETKKPTAKVRNISDVLDWPGSHWTNELPYVLKQYRREILPIKRDSNASQSPNREHIRKADIWAPEAISNAIARQSVIDESLITTFAEFMLPREDLLKKAIDGQKNTNMNILTSTSIVLPDNVDNVYRALSNLKIIDKYFPLSPEEKKNFVAIEASCGKGFSSQLSNFKFTNYEDLNTFENKTSLFKERFPNTDITSFTTKLKTAWVDLLKNSPVSSISTYDETKQKITIFASKFVDKAKEATDPALLILRSNLQAKFLTLITNTSIDTNSLSQFRSLYTVYSKDYPKDIASLKNLQNIEKKHLLETLQIKDIASLNLYKTISDNYLGDMNGLGMAQDISLVDAMSLKYKTGFQSILDTFVFTKDSIAVFKSLKMQYAKEFPNDPSSPKLEQKYKESYANFLEKFSLQDGHPQNFISLYDNFIKENGLKVGDAVVTKLTEKMNSLLQTWLLQIPLTRENLGSSTDKTVTTWDKTKLEFYKRFPATSPELKIQIESKETTFRREELIKDWNKNIDFEGFEFNLNNPALQKKITSSLSAIQNETLDMIQSGKLEKVTLKSIYERSVVGKEPFFKFIPETSIQKIDLLFADHNRQSMAVNFTDMLTSLSKQNAINNIDEIKSDFSTILLKTPNATVNAIMKQLNTLPPNAVNTVFKTIFDKIVLDKSPLTKDDRLVSLKGLSVNARLATDPKPSPVSSNSLKKIVLSNVVEPKTFEVNFSQMKSKLLASFDKLSAQNIANVTISLPKASPTSTNWDATIKDIIATKYPKLQGKILYQERTDGSNQIAIESKEKIESTQKVPLEISDLPSNTIPDPIIIKEKLANSPQFQSLINDPTWKITAGNVSAFASNTSNTSYKAKPQFEKYKGDKVFADKNEALAFDRAAAFVDYFNTNVKVDSNVQWTINSAVGGESAEDIEAINLKIKTEEKQALRKTRQKATLDITFAKTEELAPTSQSFVTTETYTKDASLQMETERTFSGRIRDIGDGSATAIRNTGDFFKSGLTNIFSGDGLVHTSGGCGCDGRK